MTMTSDSSTAPTKADRDAARSAEQQRVDSVVGDVVTRLRQSIVDHQLTYAEYDALKRWLIRVGEAGEWPLVLDVFLESQVEQVAAGRQEGSAGTILGPYYIPDAPELPSPATVPMRDDEAGERLTVAGQVRGIDGQPLGGAVLDWWQADAEGYYSHFADGVPAGNLRAKVIADADGRFEVAAVAPAPYQIPTGGPCGALLAAANWSAWRPAHLHLIVSAPGHRPLTTQLFFPGDRHLDDDIATAVKPELVLDPQPAGDGGRRAEYDFVLEPA
jgi:catechol 1,2-dioxygenase